MLTLRNLESLKSDTAIAVLNAHRLGLLKLKAGSVFHADATPFTPAATATDLPTGIAMANAVAAVYGVHIASACDAASGQGAHIAADVTNTITAATATDQTTLNALAVDLKAKYNLHRAVAGDHATADATNTVTAAAATDLTTSLALVNEVQTKLAAHMSAALGGQSVNLVAP